MSKNPQSFWEELKRRRVIRIIPVYAAAAFVLLEFVDIIAEPFGLPDWTLRFVFVLLCIGLVISIIFSWVYDITPEGLKKTKPADVVSESHPEKPSRARGWKIATYASLVIIITLIILNIFAGRKYRSSLDTETEKSIAVLPLNNLSNDTTQAYFCEGIREAILYHLQKMDAFSVRSRTSADHYRNTDKTTAVIGNELNANYLVEGSIGCEGNKLRIWVQLIDTKTDKHIWACDYIKERVEIFSIQSEIAQKIASELKVALSPDEKEKIDKQPTNDLEAYQAYLRGRYYVNQPHFTLSNWLKALENIQAAVDIDTTFALAYAELARVHGRFRYVREDLSDSRLEKADLAARKALQYGSDDSRVHLALGYYYLYAYRDKNQALEHLKIAEKGMPDDVEVLIEKGDIVLAQGNYEEAIQLFEKASEASPRDASILTHMTFCLWCTRQYEYGIETGNKASSMSPDNNWPYLYKAFITWSWKGTNEFSRDIIKHVDPDHEWYIFAWYWQEVGERNFDKALQLVSEPDKIWGVHHKMWTCPQFMLRAFIHEYRGETELARSEYQAAVDILEKKVAEVPTDPRYHSALGIGYAGLGQKEKAIKEGIKATEILPIETDAAYGITYIGDLAIIYTMVGEYDLALDMIEKLFNIPSWFSPNWVNMDIRLAPLQSLPRYQKLVKEYSDREKTSV